ncbi:MAG: SulP family inorganic anion transporter [Gammaproteobacteria bacterium]
MIAIAEAARAGLLKRTHWGRNIIAGIVVGVVALPLAMAFAIASGVKPEQGLYTAIVSGVAVSLLGGTRIQIAGPTGAFVAILAGITATQGVDGLLIATLMAGAILILLGAARLGSVIRFIPHPVIVGFTAGIGVVIWVGQWKDFFGLHPAPYTHFHEQLLHLLSAFPQLDLPTTLLALGSMLVAIYAPRIPGLARVPGPLLAMTIATILHSVLHLDSVATIGTAFGGIPRGLPSLSFPDITFARIVTLVPAAFTIAMLGAIESLLSAVVADGMAETRHDSNQELIGQGIANMLTPLVGGFAATGAIARTATNFRNGANSPIAGIVHALTLVLVLLLLSPLAARIPLCSLAAILFVIAWNMSDAKHFVHLVRTAPRADMVILLITFALTVFTDLVVAVNVGVILSMLQFLRRMSSTVEVRQENEESLSAELAARGLKRLPANVMVYSIDGPFFFGAVENLDRALRRNNLYPASIVIRLGHVPFMDATGIQTLRDVIRDLEKHHVRVLLSEANPRVHGKLVNAGIIGSDPRESNHFADLHAALAATESPALQAAPSQ